MDRTGLRGRIGVALAFAATLAVPTLAQAFDPALEAQNFAKINERFQYVTSTSEFQARLQQANVENNAETR